MISPRTLMYVAVAMIACMFGAVGAFAQSIVVVQPETSIWPLFMLAGVLACVVGLVVLRIKKPDEYARIMRSAKTSEQYVEDAVKNIREYSKVAVERTQDGWKATNITTDPAVKIVPFPPAEPPPGYL